MWIKALAYSLIILINAGCAYLMPPQKIPLDRRNYVDAVSTSWKEQLLTNLVKLRYGDTLTFLEMTSVTTSYELGGSLNAGYSTQWHPVVNTTGWRNSFLAGGSVVYSDRPTISYAPIRGENLAKTLILPIDPSKTLKGLQTGWSPQYILITCVKSINNLQNPQDTAFVELAKLARELSMNGIIRITIDESKGPTKYDITVHRKDKIYQENEPSEPGKKPGRKSATKPQKGKENGRVTDEKKEEEDITIGLLILDNHRGGFLDRTTPKKFEKKIHRFKELLWSGVSPLGKKFYDNKFKCSSCHGEKGNGEGPRASEFKPAPTNFTDASFWMGDVGGKIEKGVTQGKVHKKEKIDLKPEELKAVAAYIKQTFGRYAVYKIIDGNQQPRPSDPNCEKIVVQTYSILQVFNYLAEFIQVPAEHLEQERAIKQSAFFKSLEKVPLQFIIKSSKIHPEDSFVAIQKNDYWFYIDDKDPDSKRVFSGIAGILSLSEPGTKEGTPVLTLPVQ